jgi:hypothetical protein
MQRVGLNAEHSATPGQSPGLEAKHISEWQASRLGLISPVPLGSNPGLATERLLAVGYQLSARRKKEVHGLADSR